MEGNEIEKAAEEYAKNPLNCSYFITANARNGFTAGANWQKERENAELTRAQERIKELVSEQKDFARYIMNTPINGRTLEKLYEDWQWQRAIDEDNEIRKEAFHQRLP